ncbi:two pore domain potassium channel family protein [Thalassotalea sp. LPB0316]|uniref:ion channel n=1 Tax=Thalassotalea sp. LPB0316 TaxID=2769490 RepID=UPI001868F8E8|nr:ion channel [Thalassotalea sp. LPB0316]QOL26076.1 two pore domain potassium channel family protein [Thalassotalea sp. LPB0316]
MPIIFQRVTKSMNYYTIDDHGVKNYKTRYVFLLALLAMILLVCFFGYITLQFEQGHPEATVKTYADAIWLMLMSSTTIGFGRISPVTVGGQATVMVMFVFGVGIMGGLGALAASKILGFSDTNVKNRELRSQNAQIIARLIELEKKIAHQDQTVKSAQQTIERAMDDSSNSKSG